MQERMQVTPSVVMRPYGVRKPLALGWRLLLVAALLFVAAFYGLVSAIIPMSMMMMAAAPILLLAGICLWLLPDIGGVHENFYGRMLVWLVALHTLWPPYVALNFPGLPWISPTRAVLAALVFTFLFNLASSAEMRREAAANAMAVPEIGKLFFALWALTTISLALASELSVSLTRYFNNQIYWTAFFVLAAFVGRRSGVVSRAATVMFMAVIPISIITVFEFRAEKVIWVEYLPKWLWGDEELVSMLLVIKARAGTEIYRVRGTALHPLFWAEFLAMVFPIGLYLLTQIKQFLRKLLVLLGMLACVVSMYLTDSRTAMAGLLLSMVLFAFVYALRRRAEHPESLFTTAILFAYPAAVAVMTALVLFWPRVRVMVLGGGQHQPSSDARDTQWQMGLDILQRNPFGHGAGNSGTVLGYVNLAGDGTIDTYWLGIMLDFGVLALPIFVAMFTIPLVLAVKGSFRIYGDNELGWLIPLSIGLFNFVIITSVNSGESNFGMAFIMLGFCAALIARMRAEETAERPRAIVPSDSTAAMA